MGKKGVIFAWETMTKEECLWSKKTRTGEGGILLKKKNEVRPARQSRPLCQA